MSWHATVGQKMTPTNENHHRLCRKVPHLIETHVPLSSLWSVLWSERLLHWPVSGLCRLVWVERGWITCLFPNIRAERLCQSRRQMLRAFTSGSGAVDGMQTVIHLQHKKLGSNYHGPEFSSGFRNSFHSEKQNKKFVSEHFFMATSFLWPR